MSQLATLQRIVERVSKATDLKSALDIIVDRVKTALEADACSVFMRESSDSGLLLKASDGLYPALLNELRIDLNYGLTGLVASRAEPISLSDATKDPRYRVIKNSGDENFKAFLGVPIVDHRRLYGVLIVQSEQVREYSEDDVAFLVTLSAQLAAAISAAEISGEISSDGDEQRDDVNVDGLPGAPGVAIGAAVMLYAEADLDDVPERNGDSPSREKQRLSLAIEKVKADMQALQQHMNELISSDVAVLFDAYGLMLESESLISNIHEHIDRGEWAQSALSKAINTYAEMIADVDDDYLRERAVDIRDIGRRVLGYLISDETDTVKSFPDDCIVVGHDISASQLAEVPRNKLRGLVCTTGTQSSHVAILARALGVPTVMGTESLPLGQIDTKTVVVDGYAGRICINPSPSAVVSYRALIQEEYELSEQLREVASRPAVTKDGYRVPVFINSGLMSDLSESQRNYCDGLGLYRTELPFMVRDSFPSEDEQEKIYRRVLNSYPDQPVTLRTLDVGGDKPLKYFPVKESNPFLGWRGVRICLDHPEIFLTQLRAMLRASTTHKKLQILLPMISTLAELNEAISLISMARAELAENGLSIPKPSIGVMIEVPAAVYLADKIAEKVDFLSIGSNDLIQYLLAVDRNNAKVASLYSDLDPAFLMALQSVIEKSHSVNTPVSICGEMASDPVAVLLLLGLGIDSISVSMASLPSIKWVLTTFSRADAEAFLRRAFELGEPKAIREMLSAALVDAGLGAVIRAGKH